MQLTAETYKKIGVVYGILVILTVLALGVRFWQGNNLKNAIKQTTNTTGPAKSFNLLPTPSKTVSYTGKFSLTASAFSYKVGDTIDVTIFFEAPGKTLDGADVVLRFDPAVVNALGFSQGTYFSLVPRKDMDNETGTVKITALDATSVTPINDKVALGVVHFQALKPGNSGINFDFIEGRTSKTTLTEHGTSENILGSAEGVTITVEQL